MWSRQRPLRVQFSTARRFERAHGSEQDFEFTPILLPALGPGINGNP
jgi:hypothetical protein